MGPLCGLSLRGSSDCPAPKWKRLYQSDINILIIYNDGVVLCSGTFKRDSRWWRRRRWWWY